ncbi:MAG: LytTR family DNA-binding domain-containing protein [Rikenellaceae bacterium]
MNKLNVAIIEDEIPAARLLSSMVSRLRANWNITVLPGNVEDAVCWFSQNQHPDLIFLDIQLSDGNSFDFLSRAKPKSIIIFTTAYDQYAIRAFSVNSIDYILKPIDESRLLDAILKFESLTVTTLSNNYLDNILESINHKDKQFRTRFLINGIDQSWMLQVADIAYFYCENKITFAVTHLGTEHMVDLSLDRLTDQLDPDQFFRANRQILLCITAVKRIEPYFNGKVVVHIKPSNKDRITISKEKISSFKLWLNF